MTIKELQAELKPKRTKEVFFILGRLWSKGRITRKTYLQLLNWHAELRKDNTDYEKLKRLGFFKDN